MSIEQVTDLEEMKDPDEERFNFNDLELFETGQYSDAQVAVGDRIWNVHKNILCQRSGYFRGVRFGELKNGYGEPIPEQLPFGTTERSAELLLEFIYSGSIKTIDTFPMMDCVTLSILGEDFDVDGMAAYAVKNLWNKLQSGLRTLSTPPDSKSSLEPIRDKTPNDYHFDYAFSYAVHKAYSRPRNSCQLLLADIVWVLRKRLLSTSSVVRDLNYRHPQFGSFVLTALIDGPLTQFIQDDEDFDRVLI